MDCSPSGSPGHGILQVRLLESLSCPPPGDLANPGTEPASLEAPALAGGFFTSSPCGKPYDHDKQQIQYRFYFGHLINQQSKI